MTPLDTPGRIRTTAGFLADMEREMLAIPTLRSFWADEAAFHAAQRADTDRNFASHDARQRAKQEARWAAEGDV